MDRLPAGHVFIACSVDGFIARPDGDIRWLTDHAAPEGEDFGYAAFIAKMDAIVMGRGSFEQVLSFDAWPYDLPVTAMSATLDARRLPEGADAEITRGTPSAVMADLARRGAERVYVDGGRIVRSFLREGLIARMTITRIPLLLGEGRPLFGATGRDIALRLVSSRDWSNGFVQTVYDLG